MNILIPNETSEAHLENVIAEMRNLGAPAIRAAWSENYGAWVALEGSHRIVAAQRLGLTPTIIQVPAETEEDFELEISSIDPDHDYGHDLARFMDDAYNSPMVTFEE